ERLEKETMACGFVAELVEIDGQRAAGAPGAAGQRWVGRTRQRVVELARPLLELGQRHGDAVVVQPAERRVEAGGPHQRPDIAELGAGARKQWLVRASWIVVNAALEQVEEGLRPGS